MTNNQTSPKQGVRARERNAIERIQSLENDLMQIAGAVQQTFNELGERNGAVAEVLDAVVAILGKDVVQAKINQLSDDRANEQAQKAKDALAKAIEIGQILPVTEGISEDCIITGIEKDKDGNVIKPGYVQVAVSAVKQEFKDRMLLQNVGFSFPTELGGTFEVTGVYRNAPPKAEGTEAA